MVRHFDALVFALLVALFFSAFLPEANPADGRAGTQFPTRTKDAPLILSRRLIFRSLDPIEPTGHFKMALLQKQFLAPPALRH
jgi:hypothetical protein